MDSQAITLFSRFLFFKLQNHYIKRNECIPNSDCTATKEVDALLLMIMANLLDDKVLQTDLEELM